MQKGELSEPVKTQFGWHVIKLEDRRQKPAPAFEQVKDTIMNSLAVRKAQEKSAELRGKAKVDYVDAGIKKMVEDQKKQQAEAMEAAKKAAEQGAQPGAAPGAAPPPGAAPAPPAPGATPPAAKP
jgi:peptidyl-prolyl cis-trans isomerase C